MNWEIVPAGQWKTFVLLTCISVDSLDHLVNFHSQTLWFAAFHLLFRHLEILFVGLRHQHMSIETIECKPQSNHTWKFFFESNFSEMANLAIVGLGGERI